MHAISSKQNCWVSKSDSADLIGDFVDKIPMLTALQPGRRFPIMMALRVKNIHLYFCRHFEETAESTSATFRAIASAYQAEEVILAYLTEMDMGLKLDPPYTLMIQLNRLKTPRIIIGKSKYIIDRYHYQESLARIDPIPDYFDFALKDVMVEFQSGYSSRIREAQSALIEWQPEINWGFNKVAEGELPPMKSIDN